MNYCPYCQSRIAPDTCECGQQLHSGFSFCPGCREPCPWMEDDRVPEPARGAELVPVSPQFVEQLKKQAALEPGRIERVVEEVEYENGAKALVGKAKAAKPKAAPKLKTRHRPMPQKRLGVPVDPAMHAWIKAQAEARKVSIGGVVGGIIKEALEADSLPRPQELGVPYAKAVSVTYGLPHDLAERWEKAAESRTGQARALIRREMLKERMR